MSIKLLLSWLCWILALVNAENNTNLENPLIYNRLRHDDDYLQIYRNLQPNEPHEEKPIVVELNRDSNKKAFTTYFESNQFGANNITYEDLIVEALDQSYSSRTYMAYHHHYDDPDDRRKASDSKLVSPSRCAAELAYLRGKLDQLALNPTAGAVSPELAAFFDSYANEESGLLFGNYHWTGNWRQCSKRLIFDLDRTNTSNSISFQGRYCIASIRSDRWQARIEQLTKQRLRNYFKNPQQKYNYQRFFRIQVGICLPQSCDSTTIDRAELADVIRQLTVRKLNEPFKSYRLVDLFCLPDEASELRKMDKSGLLFLLCCFAWCSLVVAATCYDFSGPSTNEIKSSTRNGCFEKLVTALSLRRNYIRLTRAELEPAQVGSSKDASHEPSIMKPSTVPPGQLGPSDLIFIDFFKAIAMPLVMFGHMCQWLAINDRHPLAIEMGYHSIVNVVFTIEWYFAMAGFITVYYLFSSGLLESITWPQWLYSIFHRYWRLAPMYIIVFWFCRSVFHHTGKGPVWDYGTTNMTLRGICKQENWLWPLTLTSNLHSFQEECILPSWFISSLMQFYLITPFILIGLAKWPKTTWLATVGLIMSSVSLRIYRYYIDPQAPHLDLLRPRRVIQAQVAVDMYPVYLYPQYRISTYLMGLLAGHYTYMVLSGKWNSSFYQFSPSSPQPASICRRITWFMSLTLCVAMIWASWLLDNTFPKSFEPFAKHFTAFLHGLNHPGVGLAFVLLITTFMLGQSKKLRSFLSHRVWSALSRINFSLLLFHCEIIHWNFESGERPPSANYASVFQDLTWLLFQTYPLAVVGTLLIEFPLAILEREFIGNWLKRKSQVQLNEKKPDNKFIDCDEKSTSNECKQNFDLVYVIDCKGSAQTPVNENSHSHSGI